MLDFGVRFEKLSKLVANNPDLETKNKNPLAAIEDEKTEHAQKMERMEAEMRGWRQRWAPCWRPRWGRGGG